MSTHRPLPPEVYRRRRLVVGVAALVLLALVVALVFWVVALVRGAGNASEEPEPTASPSASAESAAPSETGDAGSASAAPSDSSSAEAGDLEGTCTEDQLTVVASADAREYGPDENPIFELSITNDGDEACDTNVGTNQQVFTVTSGSDRIFATTDCQVDGTDQMMTLEPGQTETSRFEWDKVRTQPGCERSENELGAGTYRITVAMGAISSEPVSFSLTD
ncbi:hypothetical protein [Citricoccus muralis]|uniref:Intracellular proteinase inhibitor BsuPI n=1 Tax=Citricoccus muralis TaxID=169134 RepID=A0ABY8H846_9MICC|nr:hypothetical protein [Citricoccus muralis]WFP16782.1 hypothetical protein P8192_01245 [Citricoccus muralis]